MISATDIGWLAGLLEGEGWFGLRRGGKDVAIAITMTDGDVIDRVMAMLRFGSVWKHELPSGLTAYRWTSNRQVETAGLMMTLFPLMGERRRQRIIESLAVWRKRPMPRDKWTHCSFGHELSGHNLVIIYEGKYAKRQCRTCRNRRHQKYDIKRRAVA